VPSESTPKIEARESSWLAVYGLASNGPPVSQIETQRVVGEQLRYLRLRGSTTDQQVFTTQHLARARGLRTFPKNCPGLGLDELVGRALGRKVDFGHQVCE